MRYFLKKAGECLDQGDDSRAVPRVCPSLGVMNRKADWSAQLCVYLQPGSASQKQSGRSEEVALTEIGVFKRSTMKQKRGKRVEGARKEQLL